MSSSPFSFWWSPPATVQIWSTHYPPWTGMHIWVLLSGSLQAGWRNQWGRVNHLIYVFLWNMAITPPSLLISSWWLACLPQRCGALVHPPIHINSETSPWGTCAGGKKVKRRKTQTKNESMHSYSSWYTLWCWLFSLEGFLRSSPPCPSLSPQIHNGMHIRTALQLMLIRLSWLKAQTKGGNKGWNK